MYNRIPGNGRPAFRILAFAAMLLIIGRCGPDDTGNENPLAFESYPQKGDVTSYGMPLSIDNAATFLEYYEKNILTPEQEAVKKEALTALKAPCCDDNTMYTCCCPCNLAKSVWGLSAYLIAVKDYDSLAVRESALEWLRFIRPDYYQVHELEALGLDPKTYGLTHIDTCYEGKCNLPFSQGGCGGMDELILE